MRACNWQLVLVLLLIGGESGASFVNHQSEVKQNQSKRELLSTLNWKPLSIVVLVLGWCQVLFFFTQVCLLWGGWHLHRIRVTHIWSPRNEGSGRGRVSRHQACTKHFVYFRIFYASFAVVYSHMSAHSVVSSTTVRMNRSGDTNEDKQINPLSPNSDQSLLSPYSIIISASIQVMRIKEMIIKHGVSWCLAKFSELVV